MIKIFINSDGCKFIKYKLLQDFIKNSLNTNTLNTIKKIDKLRKLSKKERYK